MKKLIALGAGAVLLLLFSCHYMDGDCQYGEGCVTDKVRRVCSGAFGDSRLEGNQETCAEGSKCVDAYRSNGRAYAACAIGDIDPKCDRDEDITYCDGNTWVRCKGHYREELVDCADEVCAAIGSRARCVRSLDPDPHCSADAGPFDRQTGFCEGDVLFGCFGSFSERAIDCAADGQFCRVVGGEGACRLQPEPDPRCDDTREPDFHCDGDVAVKCHLGWREATLDCAAQGKHCVTRSRPESNVPDVRCE